MLNTVTVRYEGGPQDGHSRGEQADDVMHAVEVRANDGAGYLLTHRRRSPGAVELVYTWG